MKKVICAVIAVLLLLLTAAAAFAENTGTAELRGSIDRLEELVFAPGNALDLPTSFTGTAYIRPLIPHEETYNFPQTNLVSFEPGARSHWHTHGGMVILVTDGVGYYQEEGKAAQIIRKGDVIESPAGVKHWHGAAPDSWFSQIVIYDASYTEGGTAEEVTNEEYAALNAEEYTGRTITEDDLYMFMSGKQALELLTFSGPIYLSEILGSENVADAPGLHYVVFEPGSINNWHTHEGGQILIATDGIGYHQTEGGEVEVLYPGDVAYCPPGVKHWHGGSADTSFAHIAVNTNPEKTGLEWFDRISEEEYRALNAGGPLVKTSSGALRGSLDQGIYRFLGVPYAEAKERFVPAEPITPWDGIRDATEYGSFSPQGAILGMTASGGTDGTDNNCQNLNIWTPGIQDGKKRPVMVWLHGGGFSMGSANSDESDGQALSALGDVVVVGVNHRLGVFGHLDLSAYGEKYRFSANAGVYDIVSALQWIQKNIEAFGGDPENVTLFGQSGGGAKVLTMMSSPYAAGLFHKGIVQSGATENMGVYFQTQEMSRKLTERILEKLGIAPESVEKIQTVSPEELQRVSAEAQSEIAEEYKLPVSIGAGYAMEWEPVVDGDFLPTDPVTEESFAKAGKDIPLLIGSNLNEWSVFMQDLQWNEMTDEQRQAYAEAYPNEAPETAALVDTLIRKPMLKIMSHKADQGGVPVYAYVFTKQAGGMGVYHGAEIPYVFHHAEDPLAKTVSEAWINFARNGVPSAEGLPEWEPYTRESGATMILDDVSELLYGHDRLLISLLEPEYQY